MCAAKSPISIIQELTVMKGTAVPEYNLIQYGSGFKCVAVLGTISASAVAASKKTAKHLAAEGILKILQSHGVKDNNSNITVILNNILAGPKLLHNEVCSIAPIVQCVEDGRQTFDNNFNAVGKLNELCSQHAQIFPSYIDVGLVEQKWSIQCKLLSHTTYGRAATKKEAKQMAAKEMLNRVITMNLFTTFVKETTVEYPKNNELDEKVVNLFKEISISRKKKEVSEHRNNLFTENNLFSESKVEAKVTVQQETKTRKWDDKSEDELQEELQRLGVIFSISELQKSPLVLYLKTAATKNHPSYTFIQAGDTYDSAVIELLKKAVRDINIMYC